MKRINDIEELYKKEIEYSNVKELYLCPVCKKGYKTLKGAEKHRDKKSCYTAVSLLKDTFHEEKMFDIYNDLEINNMFRSRFNRVSMENFRKEAIYKHLAKYVQFCYDNKLLSMSEFLYFIYYKNDNKNIYQILAMGTTDKWLRRFREWLKENHHLINSEEFIERYQEKLLEDPSFLVRSLERSDVSPIILNEYIDIDKLVVGKALKYRLDQALESYSYKKIPA